MNKNIYVREGLLQICDDINITQSQFNSFLYFIEPNITQHLLYEILFKLSENTNSNRNDILLDLYQKHISILETPNEKNINLLKSIILNDNDNYTTIEKILGMINTPINLILQEQNDQESQTLLQLHEKVIILQATQAHYHTQQHKIKI